MFIKNAWYCAGWDYALSQGKNAILAKKLAGERVVLYRKPDGGVVAMEDRCIHRQAALSLGSKEGDSLRCMYHGLKFGPDGKCTEIPGQDHIPPRACVRTFPVIEKDNWIWVWLGDAAKVDPALIPFAVGPGDPDWNMKTSQMHVEANYRLEIANLADLTHLAWVHQKTLGGADPDTREQYTHLKASYTVAPRSLRTQYIVRGVPVPYFLTHLFPPETRFDLEFDITHTVPCTWVLHFSAYTQGTATEGPSNGELVSETYTCQAVVPNDEHSVEYYFSWGAKKTCDFPGLSDLLREVLDAAFLEDRHVLEAQQVRMQEKPDLPMISIVHDAGPNKMLWVLDQLLKEEAGGVVKIAQAEAA